MTKKAFKSMIVVGFTTLGYIAAIVISFLSGDVSLRHILITFVGTAATAIVALLQLRDSHNDRKELERIVDNLNKETDRLLQKTHLLHSKAKTLKEQYLRELAHKILDLLVTKMVYETWQFRACLFMLNEQHSLSMWAYSSGFSIEERQIQFTQGQGFVGHIYWYGKKPLFVETKKYDAEFTFKLNTEQARITQHVQAILGIPIFRKGNIVAVLAVDTMNTDSIQHLGSQGFLRIVEKCQELIEPILGKLLDPEALLT